MKLNDHVITVISVKEGSSGPGKNEKGKIIGVDETKALNVLVEFFAFIDGHNGRVIPEETTQYRGRQGYCWWIRDKNLKVVARTYYND